ncbi:DUF885 family protein [Rhodococcus sp. NPDC127530]|uniref:DUF885 family protein n=1 Tax=unclassified Rhodococcus (in: high G+C Gram-positive bacteria) TaxID=192944 RepID=UPI00363FAB1B
MPDRPDSHRGYLLHRPGRRTDSSGAHVVVGTCRSRRFHTWHETSRVFHVGVPGHHLQVGTAMARGHKLNRWRRLATFASGHGRGGLCELPAPSCLGGGIWDPGKAWQFLAEHCVLDEISRRHEHDRYLGWAGQAPSYAVGLRLWQQLRDDYLRRNPESDLRHFHDRAVAVGSVGRDVPRQTVLGLGPEDPAQSVSSPTAGSSN